MAYNYHIIYYTVKKQLFQVLREATRDTYIQKSKFIRTKPEIYPRNYTV